MSGVERRARDRARRRAVRAPCGNLTRAAGGEGAHTCVRLVMPSTKQMESKMLDFPEPFRPVMALNCVSKPDTTVRLA